MTPNGFFSPYVEGANRNQAVMPDSELVPRCKGIESKVAVRPESRELLLFPSEYVLLL